MCIAICIADRYRVKTEPAWVSAFDGTSAPQEVHLVGAVYFPGFVSQRNQSVD